MPGLHPQKALVVPGLAAFPPTWRTENLEEISSWKGGCQSLQVVARLSSGITRGSSDALQWDAFHASLNKTLRHLQSCLLANNSFWKKIDPDSMVQRLGRANPALLGKENHADPVLPRGKRSISENRHGTCAWGGV